jgi:DNA polymerase III epsilon subunit-like protein
MPVYISVDVETAGPSPSLHSLLAIGACTVTEPRRTFYVELRPVTDEALPEALAISGLSLEELRAHGTPPAEAVARFASWIEGVTPSGERPVFVAFNAPFDWMFVNDYFHRFLGCNPFGHSALDIKALYMGSAGVPWGETSWRSVASRYLKNRRLTHHALRDAMDQAEVLQQILPELTARDTGQ